MKAHKTFDGTIKAVNRVVAEIGGGLVDQSHAEEVGRKVDLLLTELSSLWSDPARVEEAGRAKRRLVGAWNKASL